MITQKEIAEKLGVSRTTVARAINGSPLIKPETKKKVLEVIRETNYQKNHLGSVLASRKEKIIYALIIKSKNKFYTSQLRKGLKKAISEYKNYNFNIKIIETDIDRPDLQIEALKKILKKDVAGIIIVPLDTKKIGEIFKNYDKKVEVISLGRKLIHTHYIGADYFHQGELAGEIMNAVLRPKEKILVVDNGDDNISSELYLMGFLETIKKCDFDIEILKNLTFSQIIENIKKFSENSGIKGLYINRYSYDILENIPKKYLKDMKIITNGMGKIIKKLIKDDIVIATITEDALTESYRAGREMFNIIYHGSYEDAKQFISEAKIVFKGNLK